MIVLVFGISGIVVLFGYLSHTSPLDPTLLESTVRTLLMSGSIGFVTAGSFLEFKYLDSKILKMLEEGGEQDD